MFTGPQLRSGTRRWQLPPRSSQTRIILVKKSLKIWQKVLQSAVDSQENNQNCCQQTSYFNVKMHHIRFRLGLRPRPHWGSSQCSPRPLAAFSCVLLLSGGRGREKEGRGGGRREIETGEGKGDGEREGGK